MYVSIVSQIIYKSKAFGMITSQSKIGRPWKITARASTHLGRQAKVNHDVTSVNLQDFLANVGINVHAPKVRLKYAEICLSS